MNHRRRFTDEERFEQRRQIDDLYERYYLKTDPDNPVLRAIREREQKQQQSITTQSKG